MVSSLPAIPEVADQDLKDAVSALCRAASIYHRCFMAACEGAAPTDLIREHQDLLLKSEQVIQAWQDCLGHTMEDLLEEE